MMQLWIVLIYLHQGYSLISVTSGQIGEAVTFTCCLADMEYSNTRVKWYKQNIGDTLRLITALMEATVDPTFEEGFPASRFRANYSALKSTLTILKTVKDDEGLYHCSVTAWNTDQWTGTFLSLKENKTKTVNYTVVQWPTVADPVQPGDSVTLQCSVLSETSSCPSSHSVSWFGVRKDTRHGNVLYTNKNGSLECGRKTEASSPTKNCVYHFSKNVSSSDSGTYYCALATCGEILFGNGEKLEIEDAGGSPLMWIALAVGVLVCLPFFFKRKPDFCKAAVQEQVNLKREEGSQIYSTAVFTVIATPAEREKVYAAAKALGVE